MKKWKSCVSIMWVDRQGQTRLKKTTQKPSLMHTNQVLCTHFPPFSSSTLFALLQQLASKQSHIYSESSYWVTWSRLMYFDEPYFPFFCRTRQRTGSEKLRFRLLNFLLSPPTTWTTVLICSCCQHPCATTRFVLSWVCWTRERYSFFSKPWKSYRSNFYSSSHFQHY